MSTAFEEIFKIAVTIQALKNKLRINQYKTKE